MPFAINTNIASLQAQNYLRVTNDFQAKTIARVTSGLRIITSGDDAAGLAIANGYRSDEAVLTQGVRNANDGLSQLQTADGGISNISQLLDRARTLATQSASGAFTGDRTVLNSEFQSVVSEIDRQAQAIGLVQGGTLAKSLNIFIGGGQSASGVTAASNGSVQLDLSNSTVDSTSLGLKGVQAIGSAGTDIGSGSATTSLSQILANSTNTNSVTNPGFANFVVKGPGFDGNGVKLSVNTANLGGTSDLVGAVNAAIQAASNGGTQQATALKNANITAAINTDVNGKQQLTFTSSNAAFQVEAGDRLSNALLGKFEQNASLKGTDTAATVATNGGGTANQLTVSVDGATAFTVNVTNAASVSKAQVVKDLNADSNFKAVATAHLEGDQIVLKSNGNNANSSIQLTGTTLATNLGLSTAKASAANASTGADLNTYYTAANNTASGTSTFGAAGAGNITFRFQGASESAPTDITIATTASTTVQQAIDALNTAISGDANLKSAGVTLTTKTAGDALTFTSSKGEKFDVQVTGDVQNKLGLGSFLTGAGGSVDYSALSAGATYDNSGTVGTNFAAGTQTFEISLNGQASNTHSIAVDLSQGDATASTVTSSDTGTGTVGITANNNQFKVTINGTSFAVNLNINGLSTKNDIANQINTVISGQGTAKVVGNAIVLTDNTKGAGGTIQIENGTANSILGFTAGDPTKGVSRSGASIAQAVNQAIASDSTLSAAGLVADFGATAANKLTIKSASGNDTFFRVDARGTTAAATVVGTKDQVSTAATAASAVSSGTAAVTIDATHNEFKLTVDGGTQTTIDLGISASPRSFASIASELNNNSVFTGLGATASVDSTGHLTISSNTTGTGSHIQIAAGAANDVIGTLGLSAATTNGAAAVNGFAITASTNDKLSISVDGGAAQVFTLTAGATRTAANIVSDLSGLVGATASVDANNHLVITSNSTGTNSSVAFNTTANSAYTTLGLTAGTTYSGTAADTGYGTAGATFTGNVQSAAPATSGDVDAGGSSQSSSFAFNPVLYGGDDQTVTVAAADASGAQQSLSITLRNDATGRNARSIDEALNTINTALQQSNNSTLQKIVAVKENAGDGTEKIKFLSNVSSFQVSVGTTANSTGIGAQGTTDNSTISGGGSSVDISNITGAANAVTALANAVSSLGKAQAVIGRGQNQLNYAVNLAQSQLTNPRSRRVAHS